MLSGSVTTTECGADNTGHRRSAHIVVLPTQAIEKDLLQKCSKFKLTLMVCACGQALFHVSDGFPNQLVLLFLDVCG